MWVDLLVIGSGEGCETLTATMGRAGRRVVLVEQPGRGSGGGGLDGGCVVAKALAHHAEQRGRSDDPDRWYQQATSTAQALADHVRDDLHRTLNDIESVTILAGRATFIDPHTVIVDTDDDQITVTADTIVINTGTRPMVPNIPGLAVTDRAVTPEELILDAGLPRHLAIVGGGSVGLEFAAMYRRFGSRVTVFETADDIMTRQDADVAAAVVNILRAEGITLFTRTTVTELRPTEYGVALHYEQSGRDGVLEADTVLVALGRKPETDALNLAAAEIRTEVHGAIAVDENLRTNQPHIFAIGHVNGGRQLSSISLDDGRIVLDHLLGIGKRCTTDRVAVPNTLFVTPPLATVGLTEKAARAAGRPVRVLRRSLDRPAGPLGTRPQRDVSGLMKFVIDADTDLILGAALLGSNAHELINTVALAIRNRITAGELCNAGYTCSSSAEVFTEVLGN